MIRPIAEVNYILPLAGDLADGGARLGIDTENRLLKAVDLYRMFEAEGNAASFILSAGSPPAGRKFPRNWSPVSMLMKHWLMDKAKIPESRIIMKAPQWGTWWEIEIATDQIASAVVMFGVRRKFHIVTSWYHVPRVKIICKRIFRGSLEYEVHSAPGANRGFLWYELYKIPAEFLGLRIYRDRIRRIWKDLTKR